MKRSLKFLIVPNHLQDNGTFYPMVIDQPLIPFEELLDEMENNTTMRKQDIQLAISQLNTCIIKYLSRGNKIKTPLGIFSTSLRGTLHSPDENFTPESELNNHRIEVYVNPSKEVEEEVARNITLLKLSGKSVKIPNILSIIRTTKSNDKNYHATDVVVIKGSFLKFDPDMDDEGVFWLSSDGNRIRSISYSENTQTKVHCQVPELPSGLYTLELSTRGDNHLIQKATFDNQIKIS